MIGTVIFSDTDGDGEITVENGYAAYPGTYFISFRATCAKHYIQMVQRGTQMPSRKALSSSSPPTPAILQPQATRPSPVFHAREQKT